MSLAIGVDLGGTWLRVCLMEEGRAPRRLRLRAVRPERLPETLRALARRLRWPRAGRLTVGSTGIWNPARRRALGRALAPLARRVRVLSDVELAHEAAFAGGAGVLVVAGTGSIAFARDARGRGLRRGGLGPLLGDEGSAFWIGRAALAEPRLARRFPEGLALRLAHDPAAVRKTAALARALLSWARREPAARALRREAARRLAALARESAAALRLPRPVALALAGSLFADRGLKKDFLAALGRGNFALAPPGAPAELAAAGGPAPARRRGSRG